MGLGQMIMALLATVLLSIYILNMNKNTVLMEVSADEYKIKELAISKAQSIIDEAQNLRFDESASGFTNPNNLGLESGESFTSTIRTVDDFDDYNSYQNTAGSDTVQLYIEKGKVIPKVIFKTRCSVKYVSINNLDQPVNFTTRYKRLEVRVWSDAYINPLTDKPDTVKLYTISGDWDI